METTKLISTLLFYAQKLADKREAEEFQEELTKMGITWDYYYRALESARIYLQNEKDNI